MVSVLVGASLFWVFVVTCFLVGDIFKWIRSIKMSQWSSVGAMGVIGTGSPYGTSNATMTTNPTGNKTTLKGKVHMEDGAVVEDIDVGNSLKLLTFFLQSRHPEIFEEYEAIRKIKES